MGNMQELAGDQHSVRFQRAVHRGAVRALLADPSSVDANWRAYFDELRGDAADVSHAPVVESFRELARNRRVQGAMVDATTMHKQVLVLRLISKYRTLGMLEADLDPLHQHAHPYIADLDLATYGFSDTDMDTDSTSAPTRRAPQRMRLRDIVAALKETYTRTLGAEYMYITDTATKRFFQERLEPNRSRPNYSPEQKKLILERADRGGDARALPAHQVRRPEALLGRGRGHHDPDARQAHREGGRRGRGRDRDGHGASRPPQRARQHPGQDAANLFSEFEGKAAQELPAGDVKYHQGFSSDVSTPGGPVHLTLAFNPSHLEIVNPVVEGSVRARQHRRGDTQGDQVLPILIHGDAAIAGQGVNQECLNMAATRGYYTGGTIHIVVNNQIGFTTPIRATRAARRSARTSPR
jgi:2-oxoglutarate dehydrogenase E1 component